MNNRKDFITKDAELKHLRERVSYLELENENLRLKLKLRETEKPQPEKKRKFLFLRRNYRPVFRKLKNRGQRKRKWKDIWLIRSGGGKFHSTQLILVLMDMK